MMMQTFQAILHDGWVTIESRTWRGKLQSIILPLERRVKVEGGTKLFSEQVRKTNMRCFFLRRRYRREKIYAPYPIKPFSSPVSFRLARFSK